MFNYDSSSISYGQKKTYPENNEEGGLLPITSYSVKNKIKQQAFNTAFLTLTSSFDLSFADTQRDYFNHSVVIEQKITRYLSLKEARKLAFAELNKYNSEINERLESEIQNYFLETNEK